MPRRFRQLRDYRVPDCVCLDSLATKQTGSNNPRILPAVRPGQASGQVSGQASGQASGQSAGAINPIF